MAALAMTALVAAMAYGTHRRNEAAAAEAASIERATDLANSMLAAFSADDYEQFSAGFTEALLESLDEGAYEEWRRPLVTSLGSFVAITDVEKAVTVNHAERFVFHAAFERDESVQFAIVLKEQTDRIARVELKPDK